MVNTSTSCWSWLSNIFWA